MTPEEIIGYGERNERLRELSGELNNLSLSQGELSQTFSFPRTPRRLFAKTEDHSWRQPELLSLQRFRCDPAIAPDACCGFQIPPFEDVPASSFSRFQAQPLDMRLAIYRSIIFLCEDQLAFD